MRALTLAPLSWVALFVGLLIAFFLLLPLVVSQTSPPGPSDVALNVAKVLAGLVAPFLVQWLKTVKGWNGQLAFLLALVVSYALAAIALLFTGGITTLEDLATQGSQVALIALAVYALAFKPVLGGDAA